MLSRSSKLCGLARPNNPPVPKPEVGTAVGRIHRWVDREAVRRLNADPPPGGVALHEIQRDLLATATGALHEEPLLPATSTNKCRNTCMLGGRGRCASILESLENKSVADKARICFGCGLKSEPAGYGFQEPLQHQVCKPRYQSAASLTWLSLILADLRLARRGRRRAKGPTSRLCACRRSGDRCVCFEAMQSTKWSAAEVRFQWRIQPIDETVSLNISAGVL